MERFEITQQTVRGRCLPPSEADVSRTGKPRYQVTYWCSRTVGFGVRVTGKGRKSFVAQRDLPSGETVLVTLGQWPELTADEARRRAMHALGQIAAGINPNAQKREARAAARASRATAAPSPEAWRAFTLRQAMEEHAANMAAQRCSPRSIAKLREELERHLSDWMDRPVAGIRAAECIDRHRQITAKSGPVQANRTLRMFRACYNSAVARHEELPANPIRGFRRVWNKERRRQSPIPWDALPAWAGKVAAMSSPVRRHLYWFVLLTGLRSEDARTIRREHVDFAKGTLHRPSPKGGEARAFTIPLSGAALAILRRRFEENELWLGGSDCGWAFPTRRRDGSVSYVQEPKTQEYWKDEEGKLRKRTALPSMHRYRDTYLTAAHECGVPVLDIKTLANHALPSGDVTSGYIRPSVEHLRDAQRRITDFLLGKARVREADVLGPVMAPEPVARIGPRAATGTDGA